MLRRATALALLGAFLAVGCGQSRTQEQMFAIADRYEPHGDFYAAVLLRLDPTAIQPLERRVLRLGDSVTTRALSPDRRTLALGGMNFGELVFVDLSHPTRATRMTVVPGYAREGGMEIVVHGWPRSSRLVAVATTTGAWSAPHPSELLIVDPQQRRVVRRTPIRGAVLSSASLRDGSIALLVVGKRFPSLLVVQPDGSTWSRLLRRLDLGGRDGMRLGGTYYKPTRDPALATDGGERLFVVARDRPIGEIRTRTHDVTYHSVPLARRYLSNPPPITPGSGGISLRFAASAVWLGDDQLAIGGFDELPGWVQGIGHGHRFPEQALQIVNTRSWQHTKTVRATSCQQTEAVRLCRATREGFPPDGKGSRGPSLVAYDQHWHRLYEKPSSQLWWNLEAGRRLIAGSADGDRMWELDPATRRVIRRLEPSPLANDMWPLDLITWRPQR